MERHDQNISSTSALDLGRMVLFDHHAHSLRKDFNQLDVLGFRQAFTESQSVLVLQKHVEHGVAYMHMIRQLSKLLDVENEQKIIEMRSQIDASEYAEMLFDDASIGMFVIDDGFNASGSIALSQFASLSARPTFKCLRLESLFEDLLFRCDSFEKYLDAIAAALSAEYTPRTVALKTIAPYRGGLKVEDISADEARRDFEFHKKTYCKDDSWALDAVPGVKNFRIGRSPLYHYCLNEAFESAGKSNFPVQIHCGLGDSDAFLSESNPANFQKVIQNIRFRKTKFVFLHCYPFVKEAALLAALFSNVYFDLSLACTVASPAMKSMFLEGLAVAPFSKLLAATDGHSIPETHWYGAHSLRSGLSKALNTLIEENFLSTEEAARAASAIFYQNCRQLYSIDEA